MPGEDPPEAADEVADANDDKADVGDEAFPELPDDVIAEADHVLLAGDTDKVDSEGYSLYGYGLYGEDVTTPGPTLRLKKGKEVTIVMQNVGVDLHDFGVVAKKDHLDDPIWGAVITEQGSLEPGEHASVTFTPDRKGDFFYICSRPGHLLNEMWGRIVVK